MKTVSVIMSTYKTNRVFLVNAIESILGQTYPNIEFLIICDGDRGEYDFINKRFGDKVKTILNKRNMGLPYSLNRGIANATGEYIARMDSDDISLPRRIEKQVAFLEKHTTVDLCGTYTFSFGKESKKKQLHFCRPEEIRVQLLFQPCLAHPTIMARREVFEEYKYDETYLCSQDFELWTRIAEQYDIQILKFFGLKYRSHDQQASEMKKQLQVDNAKKIIIRNMKNMGIENDEHALDTLLIMGSKKDFIRTEYKYISSGIDHILNRNNGYYDRKILKKILFNRFFEMCIQNRVMPRDITSIKKIIQPYNLEELAMIAMGKR